MFEYVICTHSTRPFSLIKKKSAQRARNFLRSIQHYITVGVVVIFSLASCVAAFFMVGLSC